jgi:multidrug efflux pump subunit AcrB
MGLINRYIYEISRNIHKTSLVSHCTFLQLTLGGIFSYSQLGYELILNSRHNVITVSTVYPGASSEIEILLLKVEISLKT